MKRRPLRGAEKPEDPVFLNRDHIVLATLQEGALVLTTTLGSRVLISASPEALNTFIDQLVNAIGSNYVRIPDSANTSFESGRASERNRFVDDGLEFVTIAG